MAKKFRIAIGALLFEGNTLSPVVTGLSAFRSKYLERGPDLIEKLRASNTEIGGAIQTLELAPVEIVPLIATHGGAGGRVSAGALAELQGELLARLRTAGKVDAVFLALHGSFIAEGVDDMEGDLLALVREMVGPVPIAVTADLHGHITEKMAANSTAIIGYRHYPHDDTFDTGRRAAGLLLRTLNGQIKPVMRVCKAPMIVPAQKQRTKSNGPLAQMHALARGLEAIGDVLHLSYFPVQPWLDFDGLGFAAVAVADGSAAAAERAARRLAEEAWLRRHEFDVPLSSPKAAIEAGLARPESPIILADTADCVGGGAAGDSAIVLAALLREAPTAPSTVLIVDPETVGAAARAGAGTRIKVRLGNKLDPVYGAPVEAEARVERLLDGQFTYSGGVMGGVRASMGPSAVLQIGAAEVLVASESSYEYADEQFRAAGIDPRAKKFVVVKNPMNFQQAYDGAPAFTLDTPGPTTANLRAPDWRRVKRPFFPLDDNFEPRFRLF
jgi:microcystin degradation protein MlrC